MRKSRFSEEQIVTIVHDSNATLAGRAVRHARGRRHVDHEPEVIERRLENAGLFQSEDLPE